MLNENNYKAFIVDDDIKILDMLKLNFELNGINCHTTTNPFEAIELASKTSPDIIISDLQMPGLDGFGLRELIMSESSLKDIPFVFLTSNESEENLLKGLLLDANDYIYKTTSSKLLVKKVSSIIKKSKKSSLEVKNEFKEIANKVDRVTEQQKIIFNQFEICSLCLPFDKTPGGDFVEKIQIDENRCVIAVADVMGKKWDAWFHAFLFKSYINSAVLDKNLLSSTYDVASVLTNLNSVLMNDKAISSHSIALTLILADTLKGTLQIAGAGSLPLFKLSSDGKVEEIAPIECALGFSPNPNYKSQTISLNVGERILAFTDGVIEISDNSNKHFGYNKFVEFMASYKPNNDLVWIESELRNITQNNYSDDLTLLEIKLKGTNNYAN